MGITHFSILKGLNDEFNFTIIEPNRVLRTLLKRNINAKFYKDDSKIDQNYDITLITTPPFLHLDLLNKCIERGDKKIFIEKPFGGFSNTSSPAKYLSNDICIGYVYRFNPCIEWLKKNINPDKVVNVSGEFLSNTLTKKPSGWRNGEFSGVLNEVGSHVIDLIQYLISETEFEVLSVDKRSIVSDIDDIVSAELKSIKNVRVKLNFNWVKKDVRKPIFRLNLKLKDGTSYLIDQQQIKIFSEDESCTETISVTDLREKVPFYLRGIDFTKQMIDLVNEGKTIAKISDGLNVNRIMNSIINHENNPR